MIATGYRNNAILFLVSPSSATGTGSRLKTTPTQRSEVDPTPTPRLSGFSEHQTVSNSKTAPCWLST
jgi:hypothetical protein